MENEKNIDEPISTTGTVRDVLEELKDHLPADLNQQQVEIAADILDAICGQME